MGQGQGVEEWNLRHSTKNVIIHIGDFFQNVSYLGTGYLRTYVYTTSKHTHTHTDTHTHTRKHKHAHTHTHTPTHTNTHTHAHCKADFAKKW